MLMMDQQLLLYDTFMKRTTTFSTRTTTITNVDDAVPVEKKISFYTSTTTDNVVLKEFHTKQMIKRMPKRYRLLLLPQQKQYSNHRCCLWLLKLCCLVVFAWICFCSSNQEKGGVFGVVTAQQDLFETYYLVQSDGSYFDDSYQNNPHDQLIAQQFELDGNYNFNSSSISRNTYNTSSTTTNSQSSSSGSSSSSSSGSDGYNPYSLKVPCGVCKGGEIMKRPNAIVQAGTVSFIKISLQCIEVERIAQRAEFTRQQCSTIRNSNMTQTFLCGCGTMSSSRAPYTYRPTMAPAPTTPPVTPIPTSAPATGVPTIPNPTVTPSSRPSLSPSIPLGAVVDGQVMITADIVLRMDSVTALMTRQVTQSFEKELDLFLQDQFRTKTGSELDNESDDEFHTNEYGSSSLAPIISPTTATRNESTSYLTDALMSASMVVVPVFRINVTLVTQRLVPTQSSASGSNDPKGGVRRQLFRTSEVNPNVTVFGIEAFVTITGFVPTNSIYKDSMRLFQSEILRIFSAETTTNDSSSSSTMGEKKSTGAQEFLENYLYQTDGFLAPLYFATVTTIVALDPATVPSLDNNNNPTEKDNGGGGGIHGSVLFGIIIGLFGLFVMVVSSFVFRHVIVQKRRDASRNQRIPRTSNPKTTDKHSSSCSEEVPEGRLTTNNNTTTTSDTRNQSSSSRNYSEKWKNNLQYFAFSFPSSFFRGTKVEENPTTTSLTGVHSPPPIQTKKGTTDPSTSRQFTPNKYYNKLGYNNDNDYDDYDDKDFGNNNNNNNKFDCKVVGLSSTTTALSRIMGGGSTAVVSTKNNPSLNQTNVTVGNNTTPTEKCNTEKYTPVNTTTTTTTNHEEKHQRTTTATTFGRRRSQRHRRNTTNNTNNQSPPSRRGRFLSIPFWINSNPTMSTAPALTIEGGSFDPEHDSDSSSSSSIDSRDRDTKLIIQKSNELVTTYNSNPMHVTSNKNRNNTTTSVIKNNTKSSTISKRTDDDSDYYENDNYNNINNSYYYKDEIVESAPPPTKVVEKFKYAGDKQIVPYYNPSVPYSPDYYTSVHNANGDMDTKDNRRFGSGGGTIIHLPNEGGKIQSVGASVENIQRNNSDNNTHDTMSYTYSLDANTDDDGTNNTPSQSERQTAASNSLNSSALVATTNDNYVPTTHPYYSSYHNYFNTPIDTIASYTDSSYNTNIYTNGSDVAPSVGVIQQLVDDDNTKIEVAESLQSRTDFTKSSQTVPSMNTFVASVTSVAAGPATTAGANVLSSITDDCSSARIEGKTSKNTADAATTASSALPKAAVPDPNNLGIGPVPFAAAAASAVAGFVAAAVRSYNASTNISGSASVTSRASEDDNDVLGWSKMLSSNASRGGSEKDPKAFVAPPTVPHSEKNPVAAADKTGVTTTETEKKLSEDAAAEAIEVTITSAATSSVASVLSSTYESDTSEDDSRFQYLSHAPSSQSSSSQFTGVGGMGNYTGFGRTDPVGGGLPGHHHPRGGKPPVGPAVSLSSLVAASNLSVGSKSIYDSENYTSSDDEANSSHLLYRERPNLDTMVRRTIAVPAGKLGIVIDTTIDGPMVHKVFRTSPLYGKLFAGDIITAIDHVNTRSMSAAAISELMIRTARKARDLSILSEHDDDELVTPKNGTIL